MERLGQGDSGAFWELWEIHQRSIFLICLAQMRGRYAEAEDALSRVMQKARDILPREARTVRHLNAWLVRLTVNLCIDMHRADQCRCQGACSVQPSIIDECPAGLVSPSYPCPAHDLLRREMGRAIVEAIEALPYRLRVTAQLFFLENDSYSQIARALQTSTPNVRKRIQEARAILRESLQEYSNDIFAD